MKKKKVVKIFWIVVSLIVGVSMAFLPVFLSL